MEPIQPMGAAHDEVRECIRRLVAVIRRSATGDSPVDGDQVEHIQKVIKVLSLSEEQVSSMRFEERAPRSSSAAPSTPRPDAAPESTLQVDHVEQQV